MTIQEQLNAINATFVKLHKDFVRFEAEKKSLASRFSLEYSRVQQKWDQERSRVSAVKEDVLKYYRIAKDNSSKELVSSGVGGQRPDIARLNRMIEQINSYSRNDPVAGQIIDLASQYIVYLDNELSQIRSKEQLEMRNVDLKKTQEDEQLTEQKKQVLIACEKYLQGDDIADLVRLFEAIHKDYEITESYFKTWGQPVKRKRMMLFGFQQFALDVPQLLCGTLKNSLGHHFNETTKMVNCPCGFTTDSSEELFIEYVDRNEAYLKKGIQALILNFLRYFRPSEYKVSVFDYIHYNADILGPLSALANGKNSIIEKTASDSKSLKQNIAILADYYRKVESKLGTLTLFQYNKQQKPEYRIPFRILIINRSEEVFRASDDPEMSYIVNNAEKFGITIIHMSKSSDGGSKGKDREKKYLQQSKDCIRIISDSNGNFFVENNIEWLAFKWLDAPSTLPTEFISKVTEATKPKELGNKYFSRYSMKVPTKSIGKRKPISIPFAIDEDDNVISCSFENDLFAAYIMGAAGSGKSTLLHTIISGLIMAALTAAKTTLKGLLAKKGSSTTSGTTSPNTSYTRVPGRQSGGYIDVTRAQDGKEFQAVYDPKRRGFIDKPTVIVGEGPAGSSKEWVASNEALKNPTIAPILSILDQAQQAGTIRTLDFNKYLQARTVGKQDGGQVSPIGNTPSMVYADPVFIQSVNKLNDILSRIDKNGGIHAYTILSEFEKKQELRNRSRKIGSK